ncbi:MAG TPA: N-6 DNA methylase [Thermomicrobiales bacterium]|nr:N-6 DNA methylase [Thermomicrobiales bacterium]
MDSQQHARIVSFIWNIADDVLRGAMNRTKYRDVILPMTVIRRLDALLEPTKDRVLDTDAKLAGMNLATQRDPILKQEARQPFYNTSQFTLKRLLNNPANIHANLLDYLDGFSPNVREILDRFSVRGHLRDLAREERLGILIEKFTNPTINLSPEPQNGLPALDNHAMGTVFEELLRRFNEENNEEAGEHFTPRDVVRLMADLTVVPIANRLESTVYTVYDGACGTGGMLSISADRIEEIAARQNATPQVYVYGQELNPETWAIAQADQLVQGEDANNIKLGSTLGNDQFPTTKFEFMISNPPYGVDWKADMARLGGKGNITDPRFVITHDGDPEYSLLTRASDGQLLFLANMIAKMKDPADNRIGSRIAEIHNGSSLFTGDAGSGESNIRRWIIENDWLEAIIALPNNMFYNTGIATYIWVLTNNKEERRRGKVQLIDATHRFTPRRKNLGAKNADLSDADQQSILDEFLAFEETKTSKIFPNEAFGYRKVTVDRPLRLRVTIPLNCHPERSEGAPGEAGIPTDSFLALPADIRDALYAVANDNAASALCHSERSEESPGEAGSIRPEGPSVSFDDYTAVEAALANIAQQRGIRLTADLKKKIREAVAVRDETAAPVVRKRTATGIEYEPDPDLRDTEQIPLTESVDDFIAREVLPYAPDAWVADGSERIGYEISFTRYFYKPQQLRTLAEIEADILALERETDGLLDKILIEVQA